MAPRGEHIRMAAGTWQRARGLARTHWRAAALLGATLLTAALLLQSSFGDLILRSGLPFLRPRYKGLPAPKMPWTPLLTPEEQWRGLTGYGSGERLRRVAHKLLSGQPIKAFALGASVTYGHGVENEEEDSYPALFYRWIRAAFPHGGHVLINRGLPGATSLTVWPCVHAMVDPDADLVIVEFTANDGNPPWRSAGKHGYEALVRTLLQLPGRPAVLLLHHWAWWKAEGDGVDAGLFYNDPEADLTTFAHFYDLPSLSLRAAAWRLMQRGTPGFKVDHVLTEGSKVASTGRAIPKAAGANAQKAFFYLDVIHPGPNGHIALADLLVGAMDRALREASARLELPKRKDPRLAELPPPMIPNFKEENTTLCILLDWFKFVVVGQQGFEWRAEKPALWRREEQKWGWAADTPGSWAELLVDTRWNRTDPVPANASAAANSTAAGAGKPAADEGAAEEEPAVPAEPAVVTKLMLGHLRSWQGMGTARVTCIANCTCKPSTLDGTSASRVTVFRTHSFEVTQHKYCRIKVTVKEDPGSVPQDGHKVMLASVMVTHALDE